MPLVGEELAGYRLDEVIGYGGMGTVFRAEHVALSRKVAVKVMNASVAADERFRARFKREARLAASLEHPNIVPVYDAGEAGHYLFIAMKFIDGTDLSARLKRDGRLDPGAATSVVAQIGAALDAAHRHGLVHRDVKPANILLAVDDDGTPRAYLTDFGVTREAEATHDLTATGAFVGSVQYAAPEQIEGQPTTSATDVYSLGCVAYECLTGEAPFRRDHDVATLWAHINDPVAPPSSRVATLSAELDLAVGRAMAKDPAARWPTASSFAAALQASLSPEADTLTEVPTLVDDRAESVPPPAPDAVGGRGRLVAGAVGLFAAAVAAGLLAGGGDAADAEPTLSSPVVQLALPDSAVPKSAASLPQLTGLTIADPVAAALGPVLVRAGRLEEPGRGMTPLPQSVTKDATRTIVRLPTGEALRYDVRDPTGFRRVFALATAPRAWAIIACEAPSPAGAEDCDTAAAGATLTGRALTLSPDAAIVAALTKARVALTTTRRREAPRLRSGSKARRADAAGALAAAYRGATKAVGAIDAPKIVSDAFADERRALAVIADALADARTAAKANNRRGFNLARERVRVGDVRLASAQRALRDAGY